MEDDVYTAERILDVRKFNGITKYYIKWKNYPSKDNTWEPEEHIIDRDLLTAFKQKRAKKNKRKRASKKRAKDDRKDNIVTSSRSTPVEENSPPISPRLEQSDTAADSFTSSITRPTVRPRSPSIRSRSPTVRSRSPVSASTSPAAPKTPTPTIIGVSRSISTPPQPTIARSEIALTPVVAETKISEVTVGPFDKTNEEIPVQRINSNSNHNSPVTVSATPLPANNVMSSSLDNNATPNNCSTKNRRFASRFAILNTVITDVTVNDQTITISESKTNQGFFKEVSRHSVAVDTANSGDCIEMVE